MSCYPVTWFCHTHVTKLIYCPEANIYTALSRVRRNRDQRRQKAKSKKQKAKKIKSKASHHYIIANLHGLELQSFGFLFRERISFFLEIPSEAWREASSVISTNLLYRNLHRKAHRKTYVGGPKVGACIPPCRTGPA